MMQLAFYRGGPNDLWVDTAIKVFSGFGEFCHAELIFSDGISFSSTARDPSTDSQGKPKADGTRFARIDYTEHPERWMLMPIGLPSIPPVMAAQSPLGLVPGGGTDSEEAIRHFCASELDAGYDYAGCMRFVLPFIREHRDKWFCSEICTAALQQVRHPAVEGVRPSRVSPNYLAQLFTGIR